VLLGRHTTCSDAAAGYGENCWVPQQTFDPADHEWYTDRMDRFSILFEEIHEPGFPAGWYYAIVPTLNLTTHGEGLEGARKAVTELLQAWLAEKRANGEEIQQEPPVFFTQIDIPDAVQV